METPIEDTTLVVTGILLRQYQEDLFRAERGQNLLILELKDTKTGETGHLLQELTTDKRDIEHHELYTDNPALFKDNHPEGDWPMAYGYESGGSTSGHKPKYTDKSADEAIPDEIYDHQLVYKTSGETDDEQGWYVR